MEETEVSEKITQPSAKKLTNLKYPTSLIAFVRILLGTESDTSKIRTKAMRDAVIRLHAQQV